LIIKLVLSIVFVILIGIIMVSCGGKPSVLITYEVDRYQSEDPAVIVRASPGTLISSIDSYVKKKPFFINEDSIKMLPGLHKVEVNYYHLSIAQRKTSRTSITFEFEAKAGHVYGIKSEGGYKYWHAWIIDMADSTMVADKLKGTLN